MDTRNGSQYYEAIQEQVRRARIERDQALGDMIGKACGATLRAIGASLRAIAALMGRAHA